MPAAFREFRYDDESRAHARAWLEAASREEVRARLDTIHTSLAQEIAARAPACWASGRCCHFEQAGHRLYTTGLEAAATMLALPDIDGAPALNEAALDRALALGSCPFQIANRCAVHLARPLGCRVYFCDRSAQRWQQDLTERALEQVRTLHNDLHIPYHYAEWRWLLGTFLQPNSPSSPNA